jgi:hypothetical protein
MKRLITLFPIFFAAATAAVAQRIESYPLHTISKDVQKIQFRDNTYEPSRIITAHLLPSSKEVTRIQKRSDQKSPVVVAMTGMPSTVISKGVARKQFERSKR